MKNQNIRQYPDVMHGKTVMYVHGFMSSAQSGTVELLRWVLPSARVVARDIPVHPEEGLAMLRQMAREEQPDLIIGTSMGGMYAEMLTGHDRILVNPAFEMGQTISHAGMMGLQTFGSPRADGETELLVTKALAKEYQEMTARCFAAVTSEEQGRVWGLFGDEDRTVDTYGLFHAHYPQAIRFHGGHRLVDKTVCHYLLPVVRWIDDRQQGRERRTVVIAYDCLHDSYGHPTSSMRRAYEYLAEQYRVYILAPAPSCHTGQMAETAAWVEEYLSAPAWNRVVYANQPALIYGDYLVTPDADTDFLGTVVAYGSEQFKNWEDIIAYFEMLGGQ